jgi:hypothetical protein
VQTALQPAALSVRPGILGKLTVSATINLSRQGENYDDMSARFLESLSPCIRPDIWSTC